MALYFNGQEILPTNAAGSSGNGLVFNGVGIGGDFLGGGLTFNGVNVWFNNALVDLALYDINNPGPGNIPINPRCRWLTTNVKGGGGAGAGIRDGQILVGGGGGTSGQTTATAGAISSGTINYTIGAGGVGGIDNGQNGGNTNITGPVTSQGSGGIGGRMGAVDGPGATLKGGDGGGYPIAGGQGVFVAGNQPAGAGTVQNRHEGGGGGGCGLGTAANGPGASGANGGTGGIGGPNNAGGGGGGGGSGGGNGGNGGFAATPPQPGGHATQPGAGGGGTGSLSQFNQTQQTGGSGMGGFVHVFQWSSPPAAAYYEGLLLSLGYSEFDAAITRAELETVYMTQGISDWSEGLAAFPLP